MGGETVKDKVSEFEPVFFNVLLRVIAKLPL
jgi:hypothetical protein